MHPAAVADALLLASRAMVAIAARTIPDAKLTFPQFRALVLVHEHPGITPGVLAGQMMVNASTATRVVQRLVAKHYVERVPGDDRRTVLLHPTAAGSGVVVEAMSRRRVEIEKIVRRIPRAQRVGLVEALGQFARAADEEAPAWVEGWVSPPT